MAGARVMFVMFTLTLVLPIHGMRQMPIRISDPGMKNMPNQPSSEIAAESLASPPANHGTAPLVGVQAVQAKAPYLQFLQAVWTGPR